MSLGLWDQTRCLPISWLQLDVGQSGYICVSLIVFLGELYMSLSMYSSDQSLSCLSATTINFYSPKDRLIQFLQ